MSKRRQLFFLVASAVLCVAGLLALFSIPRGAREFAYMVKAPGYSLFWPLPFASMNGFTPEQLSSHLARLVFLTPACLLFGLGAGAWLARRPLPALQGRTIALLGALAVLVVAVFVFHGIPISDDEVTYLNQAEQLVQGRLLDPTLARPVSFWEPFTVFTAHGATGKYLFGTPLVLAPGLLLGFPLLGNVVLVFLTLLAVFESARRAADARVAGLGAALLAVCPSFVFTSATPLSQATGLAGLAVAVWCLGQGGWRGGLIMGSALGLALAARPQLVVPAALVLACLAWRDRRMLAGAVLAGVPWVAAILAYDAVVTGHALTLPWELYAVEKYGFGFPFAQPFYEHTWVKGLAIALVSLVRLNGWGLGWPVSLAGPVLWLLLGRPSARAVGPWAWISLATFLFQIPYYSAGVSDTGAPYHYSVLPFIALSTGAVLVHLAGTRWRELAVGAAVAALVMGTLSFYVEHTARLSRLVALVSGPIQQMEVEAPAVVFLPDGRTRPPAGWVAGTPLRERREAAPVVYYPYSIQSDANEYLRQLWSGRRCYFYRFDFEQQQYVEDDCERMKELEPQVLRSAIAAARKAPWRRADTRPWWVDGGWKDAFRWVPGLGR